MNLVKALVLASTMAVVALAPATAAPAARTETVPYERGSGVRMVDTLTINLSLGPLPEARPVAGERKVSIEITDDSGRPVAAEVHQGDAELGIVCGQTEAPLTLVSRKPVHLHIYVGPGCADVSTPTQGTAEFTFTR